MANQTITSDARAMADPVAAEAERVESVPVNPQDLQVRASVTVTFRLQY